MFGGINNRFDLMGQSHSSSSISQYHNTGFFGSTNMLTGLSYIDNQRIMLMNHNADLQIQALKEKILQGKKDLQSQ